MGWGVINPFPGQGNVIAILKEKKIREFWPFCVDCSILHSFATHLNGPLTLIVEYFVKMGKIHAVNQSVNIIQRILIVTKKEYRNVTKLLKHVSLC